MTEIDTKMTVMTKMKEFTEMTEMTKMTKVDGNQQQLIDFQDRGVTCSRSKIKLEQK